MFDLRLKPLQIRPLDIWCWILFILMMDFPFVNSRTRLIIKGLIIVTAFFLAIVIYRGKRLLRDSWPIIPYVFVIIVSGYLNYKLADMTIRSAFYALIFLAVYFIPGMIGRRFGFKETLESLYRALRAIVFISGAIVVFTLGGGLNPDAHLGEYLVGNKFYFSYFCMMFLAFYCMESKSRTNKKLKVILMTVLLCILCLMVKCATGTVGLATILILYLIAKRAYRVIRTPAAIIGALGISSVLVLAFQAIISNELVSAFITNVLHRSLDMTGRFDIYEVLLKIFKQSMWYGHGYYNSAVKDLVGYGNPQNGIFDILINYGIIGLVLFFGLCYFSLYMRRKDNTKLLFPIICFLYGMIICATVEICLTYFFIFGLAVIRAFGNTGLGDDELSPRIHRLRIRGKL